MTKGTPTIGFPRTLPLMGFPPSNEDTRTRPGTAGIRNGTTVRITLNEIHVSHRSQISPI